mmetsp:Transcript_35063/g.76736  ORF Transcript_35063/g.76736 Transcript_35063/m.76736 type:complete len:500 (-) Transcript_35063:56-1555(-)|eukprot:CAMPEP_0178628822 /NCGR_PEP_ID=MMETSP0698-20121128/9628_1 /TAXON_ID=265572 /ORGANISM="Extubocellulus spinifer, Strain CCMP396" /LENGTH=499 /DNA_ID=CAMNT_0020268101 /DNA_START=173 /DNA_END=1672 /DNA_ORIENTATION=+
MVYRLYLLRGLLTSTLIGSGAAGAAPHHFWSLVSSANHRSNAADVRSIGFFPTTCALRDLRGGAAASSSSAEQQQKQPQPQKQQTAAASSIPPVRSGGNGGNSASSIDMAEFLASSSASDPTRSSAPTPADTQISYPPLSHDEISHALRDITLYCITRKADGGVLVAGGSPARSSAAGRFRGGKAGGSSASRGGGTTQAAYFFLSKHAAEANLDQVLQGQNSQEEGIGGRSKGSGSSRSGELEISTVSLDKIWEKVFGTGTAESRSSGIEFRLVPDAEELLKARFLLTVTERDLNAAGGQRMSEAAGRRLMHRVNYRPAKFKGSYNDIPLFVVPQMRLAGGRQRRYQSRSKWPSLWVPFRRRRGSGRSYLPMPVYFSLEDLASDVQKVPEFADQAPATAVMNLSELLKQMSQNKSVSFDLRQVALIPPGGGGKAYGRPVAADPAGREGERILASASNIDHAGNSRGEGDSSPYAERHFWLRPRRRLTRRDYETLFGPDL